MIGEFRSNLVHIGALLNLLARNNIVGYKPVAPESYVTNTNVTTVTVGASGADYTSLATAYAAVSAPAVIELIDDSYTMTSQLVISKAKDGNGKGIKIKGKATKTTINLVVNEYSITSSGANTGIEFENIIFASSTANNNLLMIGFTSGFVHFINCNFAMLGNIQLYDVLESVFDGCNHTLQTAINGILFTASAACPALAKVNINNCTALTTSRYFFTITKISTVKLDHLAVTNCDLDVSRITLYMINNVVNTVNICGNKLKDKASYPGIFIGAEATGLAINGFTAYNAATAYIANDLCYNLGILWQCVTACTGSEPTKTNANWKPAEFTTGVIENNTVSRAIYAAAGHGIFLGFGCYNMSLQNNISTNHWYNIVVKGHNNTIKYNGCGKGLNGLTIYANDQAVVSNNTVREQLGTAFMFGAQAANGAGLINTTFRDNIFASASLLMNDFAERIIPYENVNNTFIQNVFYSSLANQTVRFEGVNYDLRSQFAAFKTAIDDSKAQWLNPTFANDLDDTNPDYYKPTNVDLLKLKDLNNQAVGAVDYK
jgi:hypothetical protein